MNESAEPEDVSGMLESFLETKVFKGPMYGSAVESAYSLRSNGIGKEAMLSFAEYTGRSMHMILASGSPRREELLRLTGWRAEVCPVKVDEWHDGVEEAETFVRRLAYEKARKAKGQNTDADLILTADTIVVHKGRILGKPMDNEHAREILLALKGKTHQVMTALALVDKRTDGMLIDVCRTEVPMRNYALDEVQEYVASGEPMDKAGAYGIQDDDFRPVDLEEMEGCYTNVMGLPLCHLARSMRRLGNHPPEDVPTRCIEHTQYDCKVYQDILGYKR
jgi:septum formation protein